MGNRSRTKKKRGPVQRRATSSPSRRHGRKQAEGDDTAAENTGPGSPNGESDADTAAGSLRRVTAQPNAAIAIMVLFVFAVSLFAADYVMNPNLVTGTWEKVVAGAGALFTFLATSTLTTTAYLVMFRRDTTAVRKFLDTLGTFATVGAILGTLLGLRLTVTFHGEVTRNPDDHKQPVMEYVSLVGSTATILTLVMVGLCWVRAVGAITLTMSANLGTHHVREPWYVVWLRRVYGVLLAFGGNFTGFYAAISVWKIVLAK